MQSHKQILKEAMKNLSAKERKEALKWIDNLSQKELELVQQLSEIQLAQLLLEQYFNHSASKTKKQHKD